MNDFIQLMWRVNMNKLPILITIHLFLVEPDSLGKFRYVSLGVDSIVVKVSRCT
ncbi:hypothetical protein HanHA89_Chr01g0024661 [Helianthus annuus]|nr:hypothetical protein HanHA89_Chr01g0024661 [Helianthus annuus]